MEVNPYAAPKDVDRKSPEECWVSLPHEIKLSGSMSVRDVLLTQALILKHRWFYAAFTLGIYVAFVLALGLLTPGRLFGSTFMVLGLIIMPAILPFTLLMIFLRLQRDAKMKTGIFAMTETRLCKDGIHSNMNQKDITLPWSAFSRSLFSKHVALLFLEDSNDHLIVARSKLVNADDWPILLEFLRQRYPQPASRGPI